MVLASGFYQAHFRVRGTEVQGMYSLLSKCTSTLFTCKVNFCRDYDSSEVHGTYNLLTSCSCNPTTSRVTVVVGLTFRL